MEALARSVNQGNSYSGKRIRLMADLDLLRDAGSAHVVSEARVLSDQM